MMKKYSFLLLLTLFVSQLMAQTIPSNIPTNGLVGWWPFNGNANDESGNGNNGTVNGATLSADRNGKANSAYNFDGDLDFVKVNSISKLNNTNSFTISVYIQPTGTTGSRQFIVSRGYDYASGSFFLCHESNENSNKLRFSVNGYGTSNVLSASSYSIPYSNWQHVVAVKNNDSIKIYVNGVLSSRSFYSSPLSTLTDTIYFGVHHFENKSSGWYPYYFKGKMDDIAIYSRALTVEEIKNLYRGCSHENASSPISGQIVLKTVTPIKLNATPSGGSFVGYAVKNESFDTKMAKLGLNTIKYNYKNTLGCADSSIFNIIVADTTGNICKVTSYDTILKLKFKLTTGINANQMTSMTLYPNPTTDVLYIEIGDAKALDGYRYRILDAVGKEVYNQLVKNPKTEIPLKSLGAAGMYLFEVIDQQNKTIQSNKIVLE